jgi:magnesium transporter
MQESQERLSDLVRAVRARVPMDAATLLSAESPDMVAAVLEQVSPALASAIAEHLPEDLRPASAQLAQNVDIPGTVAELMEPVQGLLPETASVGDAIAYLRAHGAPQQVTYLYTEDAAHRLTGLVVIRDLLLAAPDASLRDVMLPLPFCLQRDMPTEDAIEAAVHRHYPVYPVVDSDQRMVGVVRGWALFERQAVEITAQMGKMVGVDKEEHVRTPLFSSLRMRHPWLQINLFTAFGTAFVVSMFDATIEQIVVLAAFLPVLSCLAGNNGCQALAITLRGMTLGELESTPVGRMLRKEIMVGALNGFGTGLVAALAMYLFAFFLDEPNALALAGIMLISMTVMCMFSCFMGTTVPLMLKRYGADPATASSIFVLTITDIVGMGFMLVLATTLVI